MSSSISQTPKLDIEEEKEAEKIITELGYDWDDEECFRGLTLDDIKDFQRYTLEIRESELNFVPKVFPKFLGGFLLPCDFSDPEEYDMITDCAEYVVEQYNELMKTELRLGRIHKATHTDGIYCGIYITFDAKDEISQLWQTFEAKLSRKFLNDYPSLRSPPEPLFIREKGQREDFVFPVDLDEREEYLRMEKYVRYAIPFYNEDQEGESEIEYVRVVKAVRDMSTRYTGYWITFEAFDTTSSQLNTYCAPITYNVDYKSAGMGGSVRLVETSDGDEW